MEEVWAPVRGWENIYEVSSKGRLRSVARHRKVGKRICTFSGRILSGSNNGSGYFKFTFKDGDRVERRYIHRIVAETFIGPPPGDGYMVNHKDFNPQNNCVENLEWVTPYENVRYSLDRDRFRRTEKWISSLKKSLDLKMGKSIVGENSSGGKVFYAALNDCKKDGFQPSCVSNCCNHKRNSHKGYLWRFATPEEIARMKEEWAR